MEFIYAKLEMSPPHPPSQLCLNKIWEAVTWLGIFWDPCLRSRGGVQTDVGKKNCLSCHSEPPPWEAEGGGVVQKIENLWYLDICRASEPPPWDKVLKKPPKSGKYVTWAPPSSRGMGVQMNVERYEDVKMFSQSEPPPLNNWGGLANECWQVRLYNFVFTNWAPPPYKFLDPPLLPSSLSSPLPPACPPFLPIPPLPIPSHECRKKSGKLHAIPYHQQKSSPLENIPGALTFCVPPRVAHWKIWGRIFVIFGLIFTEIHTRTNSTQGIY